MEGYGSADCRETVENRDLRARIKKRKNLERRTSLTIAGAVVCALFLIAIYKLNPEPRKERGNVRSQILVLSDALFAIARVWASHGSGIKIPPYNVPKQAVVLDGLSCCDPSICSKYALDACSRTRRQRRLQASSSYDVDDLRGTTQGHSRGESEGFLHSAIAALSSKSSDGDSDFYSMSSGPTKSVSADTDTEEGESRFGGSVKHRGAASAAAALGLHLVGDSTPSMRSFFARRRESAARARQLSAGGYGAPPPTVGLIRTRQHRHPGAAAAAAAFGIHLSNVPAGAAAGPAEDAGGEVSGAGIDAGPTESDTESDTVSLLQLPYILPSRGRSGSEDQRHGAAVSREHRLRDRGHRPGEFLATTARAAAAAADSATTGLGDVYLAPLAAAASLWSDGMHAAAAEERGQIAAANAGRRVTAADGPATPAVLRAGSQLVVQTAGRPLLVTVESVTPESAGGGGDGGAVRVAVRGRLGGVVYRGELHLRPPAASHADMTALRSSAAPAPAPAAIFHLPSIGTEGGAAAGEGVPGWGPVWGTWQAPDGWEGGRDEGRAVIRLDPVCGAAAPCPPATARARLHVEVFCPPYAPPAHGSVWYRGRRLSRPAAEQVRRHGAALWMARGGCEAWRRESGARVGACPPGQGCWGAQGDKGSPPPWQGTDARAGLAGGVPRGWLCGLPADRRASRLRPEPTCSASDGAARSDSDR